MKKFFSIFFLIVFLFNAMGYFIVFQMEQVAIKEEMKENINCGFKDERITVITIDNKLIVSANSIFEQKDDEFTYNGIRYDIVKKEAGAKSTTFYAINDTKENHLFASLDNHLQSTSDLPSKHSQSSKNFAKNLLKIFFVEKANYIISSVPSASEFSALDTIYSSISRKAALLPPELA